MIGQRVSGMLWTVVWRYLMPVERTPVQNRCVIITADPTGADLLEVARLVVLGAKSTPEHEFSILQAERASEVDGLALLPANDRGWPAPISTGAALLEAGSRQLVAMHDLGKRLVLEQAHVRRLEEENAALWRVAQLVERAPRPEDYIVPSRRGPQHHRTVRRSLANLTETREATESSGRRLSDCEAAGITPLTFHRLRDTCISLARRDGARKDVFERISHNAKGDIVDGYTLFDWAPLCEAMSALRFDLSDPDGSGGIHDTDHELTRSTVNHDKTALVIRSERTSGLHETAPVSEVGGRVRVPSAPLSLQPNSAVENLPNGQCHTKCHNSSPETGDNPDRDEADFRSAVAESADHARPAEIAGALRKTTRAYIAKASRSGAA